MFLLVLLLCQIQQQQQQLGRVWGRYGQGG
jgi:hypothetical protein